MTTKRGETFAVLTVEGLLDWIKQNAPSLRKDWKGDTLAAACWFAAYQDVEGWGDCTQKDWARMRLAGMPPLDTREALAQWLTEWAEAWVEDDHGATAEEDMLDLLGDFWLRSGND